MNFKDKVCVITGGANGIGLCIAREFAGQGAKVAIIDLNEEAGAKVLKEIKEYGSEGLFYKGDISDKLTVKNFSEKVLETFGNIDYLINNAMLTKKGILSGCDFDDFNYVLRVGITAPYMLAKLFLGHFNKDGAIVNICSTRAFMSQADTESYTAAKGGIAALTHALAISLAGKVRVNSISPGWIDVNANFNENYEENHTEADKKQHLVKRVGKPQDIAKAVLFLCGNESSFITGENITVDGGMTHQMIYTGDNGWNYEGD
ncbi:MAG: SDR family oxidoreductase [Bacillota bacterium]|nr:SDR family oxidoreductase [Bacillota bacterium]